MSETRTYELKQRAERQQATRQRIVDAAVELHTKLGPAQTTVKAIAERAGVSRPTVYAHFPDDRALLLACSGHVAATVPLPDLAAWGAVADPAERLGGVLSELYGYYERLEPLLQNVERDAAEIPLVAELNRDRLDYLDEVRELLLEDWPDPGGARPRRNQAIGHALEFPTWQSLVRRQGCRTGDAAELMVAFVRAAASEPGAPAGSVRDT